jgi:hypothetical protein
LSAKRKQNARDRIFALSLAMLNATDADDRVLALVDKRENCPIYSNPSLLLGQRFNDRFMKRGYGIYGATRVQHTITQ